MTLLTGKKITLRPATIAGRRKIFEWLTLSDITHKMIGPPDFADNEIPDWEYFVNDYNPHFFDDTYPDNGRSFVIVANSEEVGHINYNEIDRQSNSVELDIWLAGSRYCNKGYGGDAINTLCLYLEQHLKCETIIIAPSARNKEAIRVYEKCGFAATVITPVNFIPDYYDSVVLTRKMNP